ncbi:MAG TPA: DUF1643 domain-containing protein [Salinivirga sp.]|uniref:DUF1643 domain-containing protein n=1 Tax=Salinivirga sp. TaxID=1970192 RepID=UPI002B47D512|nr:DUF1643 domain-containing protein [Salinivirga sp.]HKK58080.1 DUF1643 domain-containing protein [Salinivirga sp.]
MQQPDDWLYETDLKNKNRYVLGIKGENPLICFGINPSTAAPEDLDNTVRSVERLTYNNGFDSWIMLNIYPQRATHPVNIHKRLNKKLHTQNIEAISRLMGQFKKVNLWAAWGTLITHRPYFSHCLADICQIADNHIHQWLSIGTLTKAGHPRHPLYLKATTKTQPFNMPEYLRNLVKQNA